MAIINFINKEGNWDMLDNFLDRDWEKRLEKNGNIYFERKDYVAGNDEEALRAAKAAAKKEKAELAAKEEARIAKEKEENPQEEEVAPKKAAKKAEAPIEEPVVAPVVAAEVEAPKSDDTDAVAPAAAVETNVVFDEVAAKEFLKGLKVRGFGLLKGESLQKKAFEMGYVQK